MAEYTVDIGVLKIRLMRKVSPALRELAKEKAQELGQKFGANWTEKQREEALQSFFEKTELVDIKKRLQIENDTEFLLLLEILAETAQFKCFFHYDEQNLPDKCIVNCLSSISEHCTHHFEEEAYYKDRIIEFINHVQETRYPLDQKRQKLEIAYSALAELTGKDITWYLGKQRFSSKATIETQGTETGEKISRIDAFKQVITKPDNMKKLPEGLNFAGDIIIDKLFKAVKAIKSLFASGTEAKSVLPKVGFFRANYEDIGKALINAVTNSTPRRLIK